MRGHFVTAATAAAVLMAGAGTAAADIGAPGGVPAAPAWLTAGQPSATVEDRVVNLIAEQLDLPVEDVVPSASLRDDLGADELELQEVFMAVEEEFDIEIPDDDMEVLITVQDVIDYINAIQQ